MLIIKTAVKPIYHDLQNTKLSISHNNADLNLYAVHNSKNKRKYKVINLMGMSAFWSSC